MSQWVDLQTFEDLRILESQTKLNVDPTELQQWAMKLIEENPEQSRRHYYGKDFEDSRDFPSGLKNVSSFRGHMNLIIEGRQNLEGGRNVAIFGDKKGGPFLVVGAPSLLPNKSTSVMWRPGIYFVAILRAPLENAKGSR